ncbi:MAG: TonB-dependent receptor [Bacteroidia bacterium]
MRFLLSFLLLFVCYKGFSQKTKIQGVITDALTNESIIGAIITYADGKGTTTDLDGAYTFTVDSGSYTLKVSYIGYKPVEKKIVAKGKAMVLNFSLTTITLTEVEVVSDIAISRETPVAFSNVDAKKIQEELGSKDLPLILNSTPGVYATSQGGGDGDARVSIRGFNSQNVLVLLDGIPMNDMVNGRVFWSNWFGLDNLTRGVQVQRGLGASKLAIPAIGGTMNILTAGIDSKKALVLKNEYGNNRNYRIGLSYSSGRLENGWAFNFAGSYKRNDGWFDNMHSRMWFYYGKVEKRIGSHLLGLQVLGAPQTSAQRDFRVNYGVAAYSKDFAYSLGIDTTGKREYGRRYNPSWNFLTRTKEGQTTPETFNTSINHFHKPVFSLKDFIAVNEKLNISTIAYASYGRGYGTQLDGGSAGNTIDPTTGQQSIQTIYNNNTSANQVLPSGEQFSSTWVRKNHNDHNWYGALATLNYTLKPSITLSGGLDGRLYRGFVYSTVGDLLGGDVTKNAGNADQNSPAANKVVGDKYVQNIERFVRWTGAFAMAEYKKEKWSGFVNISSAMSWYKQQNHFLKKQLEVGDTTLLIGYNDVITYNGTTYDRSSEGLKVNQTEWKRLFGYTIKAGANYNLTEHMNVFLNVGHLNRAPFITFVFRTDNKEFNKVNNEVINSIELGYSYSSSNFTANVNGYYTLWNNRPTTASFTVNGEAVSTTATGMNARHMGIEFDGIYRISSKISVEGMINIADWEWMSVATATITDDNGVVIGEQKFDPSGVKVGDAAQNTYAASIRYEPIKKLYIKPQFNYFGKNYSNFSPDALVITNNATNYGPNIGRQSWRMPDYFLLDLNAGYSMNVWKIKLDVRGSLINALDTFYISDAQNNQVNNDFNAAAATVNVGMGRRWQLSLVGTF